MKSISNLNQMVSMLFVGIMVINAATNSPIVAEAQETSFAVDLMQSMAKSAAGELGSTMMGWVLGSAGAANGDVQVLNEILNELDTIESTLEDIDQELEVLVEAIDQLDCDTWVQNAEPMVNAISNLWNPYSRRRSLSTSTGSGSTTSNQFYVGLVTEAQQNSITTDAIQSFVDAVLNNDNKGINQLSIIDYLDDLSRVLIPPAGGSGLIQSCLGLSSVGPSNYPGLTDDAYYNKTAGALIQYYYSIQVQGMTMVVEASNYQAYLAAGSPVGTTSNITDVAEQICGNTTQYTNSSVVQNCDQAEWVVLGTDGQTGVRGWLSDQVTLGGAPFTHSTNDTTPVHRYINSKMLYVSDLNQFTKLNSNNCDALNSNAPCGILSGVYSDTTIGGTYGYYGSGKEGTWKAISGPQLYNLFASYANFTGDTKVVDYLQNKRGYVNLPDNTIFITNQVFKSYPYGTGYGIYNNVITFTDTGLLIKEFPVIFSPQYTGNYINVDHSLQLRTCVNCGSTKCGNNKAQMFEKNPQLPPDNANGNFHKATCYFCENYPDGEWSSGPPGWVTDHGVAASHPQFRLPVIEDVSTFSCKNGLPNTNPSGMYSMCGDNFYNFLNVQVPPAPSTGQPTSLSCDLKSPPTEIYQPPNLSYNRTSIWYGEGTGNVCDPTPAAEDVDKTYGSFADPYFTSTTNSSMDDSITLNPDDTTVEPTIMGIDQRRHLLRGGRF